MAINFKKVAKQQTILSDIYEGRTKVDKENGDIHICDFDIVPGKNGEMFAVCAINDKQFINGGFLLTKIFTAIVDEYAGDITEAREDFRRSGGIDVRLLKSRTNNGNSITKVDVL